MPARAQRPWHESLIELVLRTGVRYWFFVYPTTRRLNTDGKEWANQSATRWMPLNDWMMQRTQVRTASINRLYHYA